ncbi:hypothetical protein, partial [Escherichia coli]|uniref:hypothetical protein n=1 Tax=Escherichia coli TaxID=562 RepID=UPI00195439AC
HGLGLGERRDQVHAGAAGGLGRRQGQAFAMSEPLDGDREERRHVVSIFAFRLFFPLPVEALSEAPVVIP